MDAYSTINERWWLCIFGSFIVILIFLINHAQNSTNVSVLQNVLIPTSSDQFTNILSNIQFSTPINFTDMGSVPTTSSHQFPMSNMKFLKPSNFTHLNGEPKSSNKFGMSKRKIPGPSNFTHLKESAAMEKEKECNIFNGKWIYNPQTSPLYNATVCPFLSDQVSCQRNGRPDSEYEKWSWQAQGCDTPRFNGKEMLKRLRGKRLIIVGDSLNRNQWESLACLLYSSIHPRRAIVDVKRSDYKVFRAQGYKCSVEFYWSPLLVQLEVNQGNGSRILKLDTLPSSATKWRSADIMVFNTGHWWKHRDRLKAWDFYQYDGKFVEDMEIESAFEMGMKTWARWIDKNVNKSKTRVFFRSISPEHKGKLECYNQTEPIMDESYVATFPKPIIDIVERTIRDMKTPVKFLNITKLSQYRRDAHPSFYATNPQKQQKHYPDCSHWCLPGVPDAWNRLLYALMVLDKL